MRKIRLSTHRQWRPSLNLYFVVLTSLCSIHCSIAERKISHRALIHSFINIKYENKSGDCHCPGALCFWHGFPVLVLCHCGRWDFSHSEIRLAYSSRKVHAIGQQDCWKKRGRNHWNCHGQSSSRGVFDSCAWRIRCAVAVRVSMGKTVLTCRRLSFGDWIFGAIRSSVHLAIDHDHKVSAQCSKSCFALFRTVLFIFLFLLSIILSSSSFFEIPHFYSLFQFLCMDTTSPGIITPKTLKYYDHFPYDDLLYVEGRNDPKRGVPRLPRSKFDRMKYHHHVARFDHFCGWVYNTSKCIFFTWIIVYMFYRMFVVSKYCWLFFHY